MSDAQSDPSTALPPPLPCGGTAAVFSRDTLAMPHLEALLGVERVAAFPHRAQGIGFAIGWGDKPSAARPRRWATRHGLPFLAAEDGFLRSVGNHRQKPPPLSLVLDDLGIYYRAGTPSRLERLILAAPALPEATHAAGRAGLARVVAERLTKYNTLGTAPAGDERPIGILLVDQVFGDQSVRGGLATAATFADMAAAALALRPAAEIAVKVHPDVVAGRARGYLFDIARARGLAVVADAGNPFDLLDRVEEVFTVSSQLGFEALMAGRRVTCFGVPFYAGWGLTRDRPGPEGQAALARRGAARSLEQLFTAAYAAYPRYADPVTRAPIDLAGAIDRVIEWRAALAPRPRRARVADWPHGERLAEAAFGGGAGAAAEDPVCWSTRPLRLGASGRDPGPLRVARPGPLADHRIAAALGFDGWIAIDGTEVAADALDEARAVIHLLATDGFGRISLTPAPDLEPADAGAADTRVAAVVLPAVPGAGDRATVDAAVALHPDAVVRVFREAPAPRPATRRDRWARLLLARREPCPPAPASPLASLGPRLVAVHATTSTLVVDAAARGIDACLHGSDGTETLPTAADALAAWLAPRLARARCIDPASGLPASPSELLALGRRIGLGEERSGADYDTLAEGAALERRLVTALKRLGR